MSKIKFIRQNIVAEQRTVFLFQVLAYKFLVKNLTDGNIYIYLMSREDKEEEIDKEDCLLIPSETAQIIMVNESKNNEDRTDKVLIIAENTGEVEVQLLEW